MFDNRNGAVETANQDLTGSRQLPKQRRAVAACGCANIRHLTLPAPAALCVSPAPNLNADTWTSVIQAGRLNVNVNNFTQTSIRQLLASTTLVRAANGLDSPAMAALNINLAGAYSGNGRVTVSGPAACEPALDLDK